MVGKRGKRGGAGPAPTSSPATRSTRNATDTIATPTRTTRGSGRGRWANRWAGRSSLPGSAGAAADEESPVQAKPEVRSRIVKLKMPSLKAFPAASSADAQADEPEDSTAQSSTPAGSQNPETPRPRRSKRAMAVPESSRTTRQSARLKPSGELSQEQSTPTKAAATSSPVEDETNDDPDFDPQPRVSKRSHTPELSHGASLDDAASHQTDATQEMGDSAATEKTDSPEDTGESPESAAVDPVPSRGPHSPRLSRKRKSTEMKDETESVEATATKKPKLEEDADPTPASTVPNGNDTESHSESPADAVAAASNDLDTPPVSAAPGRRGRGAEVDGGVAAGAVVAVEDVAVVGARSVLFDRLWFELGVEDAAVPVPLLSPDEVASESKMRSGIPIKDRQEELAALFKKMGQAQQLALSVLADHSMQKIARDKNSHKDCPEFVQVQRELADYERKALIRLKKDHDLKINTAKKVYEGELLVVSQRVDEQIENIQDEMFYAARGKYMELVMGRRAAEDDEHTETDGSDPDAEEPQYLFRIGKAGAREVERGFFADSVRTPDGASAHERGRKSWEDFMTKVRLGEDLNPQMEALDATEDPAAQDHVDRSMENLLHAAQVVHEQGPGSKVTHDGVAEHEPTPRALSMLADTALSEPMPQQLPQIRADPTIPTGHRALLPQISPVPPPPPSIAHGPTDPRSFILPRPTPTQQPRRLLPARGQLGLPDPFAMNGPPQLPPPPGSNFQRLPPLPSYLPPPGHPGAPGPPGPPGLYYPSPHGPPPPPPSRRY